MIILSGQSNQPLAQKISQHLDAPLAQVEISKFPNGEKRIWVKSDLKDQTVVILQSFSDPVDEHIIEFSLLADAAKHLGAKKRIALIPWLGYSPQDKSFRTGEPISVHVIARIIESVGIDQLITVDIHSKKSLDYFSIPTLEISALPLFIQRFESQSLDNHIIISVDKGSQALSEKIAQQLNLPVCYFDKTRDTHTGEVTLNLKSGDVKDKHGIAVDDFVSTGSTRIAASQQLKHLGLLSYTDCITHALLAQDSPQQLQDSLIDHLITTDTYPVSQQKTFPKLEIISIAPLLAQTLQQNH